ncbi:MAG: hypothetical protein RIS09_446 [Actinomycetota bacterium]
MAVKKASKKPVAKKVAKKAPATKAAKPAGKKVTKVATKKVATKKVAKKSVAKKAPAKKVAKKAVKKVVKKTAKKPVKKTTVKAPVKKSAAKKTVQKKVAAKPVAKKAASKPESKKPVATKTAPSKEKAKDAKPSLLEDDAAEKAPVKRGRKYIYAPDEIPEPVPLDHQGAIEFSEAIAQPDSKPKEKTRVQDDDSMWTGAELKAMRKVFESDLIERQEDLDIAQRVLTELIENTDDGAGAETADTGNMTLEREMQISKVELAQFKVEETQQAIVRLDSKVFGLCEECGKPIGKLRLQEANPYATMCIRCKEAADKAAM